MKKLLILFSLIIFILSCATVPYSQRKSVILFSSEQEMSLGEQAFAEVLKTSRISEDKEKVELIKRVGERIAKVADQPKYKWEFILIDDNNTVNAFCLPGGKVAFYTGILPLCQDEDGIAVVMAHEIAHAIARHGAERMSQGMIAELGQNIVALAVEKKTPEARKAILTAYGLGVTVGVLLPYSRQHEYEADYIGLILMAKAGYDPNKAVEFWQRMLKLQEGKTTIPEFLSTHPNDKNRIENIKKHLPEALKYYNP
ncbi:MAG: M48 family metallopeptidase [Endomicrobia bacterium]|nr:M48 family metallopeptidase [Endomicrobiia bacterium]